MTQAEPSGTLGFRMDRPVKPGDDVGKRPDPLAGQTGSSTSREIAQAPLAFT